MKHAYWVIGYSRSGTSWLTRMLLDLMGKWDLEHYRPSERGHVAPLHWHLRAPKGGGKVIFIIRDPRDIVVSLSALHVEMHSVDRVLNHIPRVINLHTMAAIDAEFEYWLVDDEPDCIVRYEKLYASPATEIARVADELGIEIWSDPAGVAARHTLAITIEKFMQMKGEQTYRAPAAGPGIGNWRDVLFQDQGRWIEEHVGHWLRRFDYEESPDWWQELPER